MNARQLAQKIKHELEQVVWPEGSGAVVFGSTTGRVAVFAGAPTEEQIPAGFPWALVGIDSGTHDPDEPGLITQGFTVTVAAEVAGDPMGQQALTGGPVSDRGKSAGRGVLDVIERARSAVQDLTGFDGVKVILSATSTGSPSVLGRGRHMALADVSLTAVCTSAEHYMAPQRLRYQPLGSSGKGTAGRWTWDGRACEARFDFYRYMLRRKRGTTPSVSASDGEELYTGTSTEWVGVQESGYVYTIMAQYNSRGVSAAEGTSTAERGSYRVA